MRIFVRLVPTALSIFLMGFAPGTKAASLEGTWRTGCVREGMKFQSHVQVYSGNNVVITFNRYLDPRCRSLVATTTLRGTFKMGEESPTIPGRYPLDVGIASATIKPVHLLAAAGMNAVRTCGLTGWRTGVARDVAGLDCGEDGKIPAAGNFSYDIAQFYGDNQVAFGLVYQNEDRLTSAGRPTHPHPTEVYSRDP